VVHGGTHEKRPPTRGGDNSHKSETRISAIADFARKGKQEKKALPLFPLTSLFSRARSLGMTLVSRHQRHVTHDCGARALAADGTQWGLNRFNFRTMKRGTATEVAMPLMYLPLIMYASWMEFLAQPFKASAPDREMLDAARSIRQSVRPK
jgi:hypothetical protein